MIEPVILSSTDAVQAKATLQNLFNDPVTILLVIGDDSSSQTTLQKVSSLINSDDHFYRGVRVVQAPNASLVTNILSELKVNPRLDPVQWSNIDSYMLFSISNVFHNIGDVVLVAKYGNRPKYYIERLVLMALAFDKDLTV